MVDALHRACRWLRPTGCILDIHPTANVPTVEADGRMIGRVDVPDGPDRHAAADAALHRVIDEGLLVEAATHRFEFYTWGDTLDELREHIEENWRDAHLVLDAGAPAGRCRATERVRLTKLLLGQPRR